MNNEKGFTKPDKQNAFASSSSDDRPTTFKDTLKDMAESSSLHGITKIVSSRQIVVKILWSLLVLAAFSVFSIQLYYLFKTYYSYPSQTSVTLDFDSIDFPAITLCNINPVRKSKLDQSEELQNIMKTVKNSDYYGKRRRRRRKRETINKGETRSMNEGEDISEHQFKMSYSESQTSNGMLDNKHDDKWYGTDLDNTKLPYFNERSSGFTLQGIRDVDVNLGIESEVKFPSTRNEDSDQINEKDVSPKQKFLDLQPVQDVNKRYKRNAGDLEAVKYSSVLKTELSNHIQTAMSSVTAMPASTLSSMAGEMSSLVMTASPEIRLESSQSYQDMSNQNSNSNFLFSTEDLLSTHSMESILKSNYEVNSDIIDYSVNVDSGVGNSGGSGNYFDSGYGSSGGSGSYSDSGYSSSDGSGSYSDSGYSSSDGSGSYSGSYFYTDYGGSSSYYSDYSGGSWAGYNYYPDYNYYYDQLNAVKDEWDEKIENFKKIIKNETMELRKEMGHQKEDMILSATFAGRIQNVSYFKDFMSVEYGNCYTIESPKYVAWRSGPTHALKLTLNVEIDEYVDNLSTGYGIRIVFHEPGTYPLPSHEGITLSPGTETNIGLRRVQITRLGQPHGDCIDGMEFKSRYDKKYSISACYEFCRILKAIQQCDCIPAEAPDEVHLNSTVLPVCNTTDDSVEKCLLSVDVMFDSGDVDCSCNGPCQETVYTKTLSSTYWPTDDYLVLMMSDICETKNTSDFWRYACENLEHLFAYELSFYRYNFLRVLIYYEDLNYESIEEEPMYESVRFLSDIGGAMGLFLGASVLSFVEFVQLFLEIFLYFKHKNERRTRVSNFKNQID